MARTSAVRARRTVTEWAGAPAGSRVVTGPMLPPRHAGHAAIVLAVNEAFSVASPALGTEVTGEVWACEGLDPEVTAPLLVVHDGPAYDAEAGLTRYLQEHIDRGGVPPLRAALLTAPERDRWYSANSVYAAALAEDVVPGLVAQWPTTRTIGVGASLGALAWLHAQSSYPEVVDGMFLQSG